MDIDYELTGDERQFVEDWAKNLDVPVPVLLGRILDGAIEGDVYVEKRPAVD